MTVYTVRFSIQSVQLPVTKMVYMVEIKLPCNFTALVSHRVCQEKMHDFLHIHLFFF